MPQRQTNRLHPPKWVRVIDRFEYVDGTLLTPGQRLRFTRRIGYEHFMRHYGHHVEETGPPQRDTRRDDRLVKRALDEERETAKQKARAEARKATRKRRRRKAPERSPENRMIEPEDRTVKDGGE